MPSTTPFNQDPVCSSPLDGLHVIEEQSAYWVTGSTEGHLCDVIALVGPRKHGRSFAAYTDWEVVWSYRTHVGADGVRARDVHVQVKVTMRLPRFDPPRTAPVALRSWWDRRFSVLYAHELGHRDIAVAAGRAVLTALRELPAFAREELLHEAAASAANRVIGEHRAQEIVHDTEGGGIHEHRTA